MCSSCGKEAPAAKGKGPKKGKKKKDIQWICCDSCQNWFHTVCVKISDVLLPEVGNFWYFCVNCSTLGTLIAKAQQQPASLHADADIQSAVKKIDEITAEISKLKTELDESKKSSKKLLDRMRSHLAEIERRDERNATDNELISNIHKKIETIESGAKLANACSWSVNNCRIAINKIPFQQGECVRNLVDNLLFFLGLEDAVPRISSCFRLPVKASKWNDRSLSPTIIVVFDSRETKEAVLRRYFERYKEVKLSILQSKLPLEYRFTMNEVLSIQSFRLRNLALRLKQKKLIDSVFIRNDSIAIRLPHQKTYIPVQDPEHLLQLTQTNNDPDETADFYDAVSTNTSSASRL